MTYRKLENNRLVSPLASIILGIHLLIPITVWLGYLFFGTFEADWKWKSLVLLLSPTGVGLMLLKEGLQDVYQKRFLGEVELFVFGAPVFGEVLPVMCVIPTKRLLHVRKLSASLYWDEVVRYETGGDPKRERTLITDFQAGDGTFHRGDVLRQDIPLCLPSTLPEEKVGRFGRTVDRVSLTLKLCITIEHCPDVNEEYKIAVLENRTTQQACSDKG